MSEEDWGAHCERRNCEHTKASHITGTCRWCACRRFLAPGYDDESTARVVLDLTELERLGTTRLLNESEAVALIGHVRELRDVLGFIADWARECQGNGSIDYGFAAIEARARAACA